jgi:hypothetical protein
VKRGVLPTFAVIDSVSPLGFGPDDPDPVVPDQGGANPIAARQRRRLERRQARLGDGASAGVYDTALAKGIAGEVVVGEDLARRLKKVGRFAGTFVMPEEGLEPPTRGL